VGRGQEMTQKQSNKQTSKQANKQTSKQANKQTVSCLPFNSVDCKKLFYYDLLSLQSEYHKTSFVAIARVNL
jgi:hypothetical protein